MTQTADPFCHAMTAAGYVHRPKMQAVAESNELLAENAELRRKIAEQERAIGVLREALVDARSQIPHTNILLKTILQQVSDKHEVSIALIKSDRRNKDAVRARQEFMWRACNETTKSLPDIGRMIHRDHTTVMHGRDVHQARLDSGEVAS